MKSRKSQYVSVGFAVVMCVVFGIMQQPHGTPLAPAEPRRSRSQPTPKAKPRFADSGNSVVSDRFLRAVQWVESRNNPKAVGTSGERGLFQIMPDTWKQHTSQPFSLAFDGAMNRKVAVLHLQWIEKSVKRYGAEPTPAVVAACYNAGVERMRRVGFDTDRAPGSTRQYVRRVAAMVEE